MMADSLDHSLIQTEDKVMQMMATSFEAHNRDDTENYDWENDNPNLNAR